MKKILETGRSVPEHEREIINRNGKKLTVRINVLGSSPNDITVNMLNNGMITLGSFFMSIITLFL